MRPLFARLARRWRALTGTAPSGAVALGLLACLCTVLAVAGPRAASQLRTSALRQVVAAAPAAEKTVVGRMDDNTLSTGEQDGLSAGQLKLAEYQLRRNLRGLPLAPATADWISLTTPPVSVTVAGHSPALQAVLPPKLELSYRDALASNVRVLAGRLPAGQPASQPGAAGGAGGAVVQAAVTAPTARRFGLTPGSRLPLPGTGIVLVISGIVQPAGPAATFWTADPAVAAPELIISGQSDYWFGGAFIAATAVSTLQARFNMSATQVTWTFPLELNRLTAAEASRLRQRLAGPLAAAGHLSTITGTTVRQCYATGKAILFRPGHKVRVSERCVTTRLRIPVSVAMSSAAGSLIAAFEAEASSVGGVLDLLSVSLAVLAAAVVLLAGWLLVEQRRPEFAVLRARGAARRQLAMTALAGSAVTVLPGAAAGAAIAVALTPAAPTALAWWLAGLVVLTALAGPVLITAWTHRGYAPARPASGPGPRLAAARRLIVEAALLLGAAGGLLVLRVQGSGSGQDLYPSAAPALLAIGVAIVVLRLYPPLVRGLLRLTSRRARATAFVGLARAARAPVSAALPAFGMVLALALVSFAGMLRGAVIRGEVAASWQQAGADAVISGPAPVTAALQHSVAALPGVQHVAAAGIAVGSTSSISQFSVLLVDPRQYAAVLSASPLPQPPPAFTRAGTGRGPAGVTPVLAAPDLAARVGAGPVTILLDGQRSIRVRVVGLAPAMSAVTATSAGYLVLDRQAAAGLSVGVGLVPDALLVAGPSVSQPDLRAAVHRHARGATVVFRSQLLGTLAATPLRHGAYLALLLGAAAAACCCLLVLLLSLMLSAPSRQQALARLGTMGLSAAQRRLLALVELLPQLLAVLAGGLACAVVLVPALGPALSLAVLTGSTTPVPVLAEPAWLAATAIALLVLAIATLTAQAMLADRGAPRSLQIGG